LGKGLLSTGVPQQLSRTTRREQQHKGKGGGKKGENKTKDNGAAGGTKLEQES